MTEGIATSGQNGTATTSRTSDCVIVFGSLRSGTTMLRLMLDGHPDLSCIGETDYLMDFIEADGDGWRYDLDGLRRDRIFQASGLRLPEATDGRAVLCDLIGQIRARHGGRPVLMMHRRMEDCARMLPDAPIVRLRRDPRDVARSAVGMGWAGNVYYGADFWIRAELSWRAFEARNPTVPVLLMRYENLVREPEGELSKLCAFLKIPYDPTMLDYPGTTTYGPPDAKLAFQWKSNLTARQVAQVEARVGDLLSKSGYRPASSPDAWPGRLGTTWLGVGNRAAIWSDLIRKYGLADPVARAVARRLGLRGMLMSAERRMDDKTAKFLK